MAKFPLQYESVVFEEDVPPLLELPPEEREKCLELQGRIDLHELDNLNRYHL